MDTDESVAAAAAATVAAFAHSSAKAADALGANADALDAKAADADATRTADAASKAEEKAAWHQAREAEEAQVIAADKYSVGPSILPICTRCCFTMTNMIQVCSNFH